MEQRREMVPLKLNSLHQPQLPPIISKHQQLPMLLLHSQLSDVNTIVAFFDYQRL